MRDFIGASDVLAYLVMMALRLIEPDARCNGWI
jgi:hypothetical protein